MFKARLRSWKVRKNCTTKEMVRIIKITNERAQMGKETCVRVRGLEVDATKLRKFRQRKRLTDKDLTAGVSSGSTTPTDISCFTPKLDPIDATSTDAQETSDLTSNAHGTAGNITTDPLEQADITLQKAWSQQSFHQLALGDEQGGILDTFLPGEVHPAVTSSLWGMLLDVPLSTLTPAQTLLRDQMFTSMNSYFEFYFQSPTWVPHAIHPVDFDGDEIRNPSNNNYLCTIEANQALLDFKNPGALVTLYEVACLLFQRGEAEEAYRMIQQASGLIEGLLKDENPQLLSCLFLVICILEAKDRKDLVEQLLNFAYWKSADFYGAAHPIPCMISCCSRAAAQHDPLALQSLQGTVITFEKLTGQHHTYTLRVKQIHAWGLFQQGQFDGALGELQQLRNTYKYLAGEDHVNFRHALFETGHVYAAQGKLNAAEAAFHEVYRLSEQKHGRDPPVMINLECLRMLAVVYRRQDKLEEVVPTLCKALPVAIKLLGQEHPTVLLIGHELKKMLR
jgi:tetratricopeptide (TPR) repeat protein